jgi:hypothetical protein
VVALAAVEVVALLGIAGVTVPSSVTGDEPRRSTIAAQPEADQGSAAATATLSIAGRDSDGVPDAEPDVAPEGDPAGGPDAASDRESAADLDGSAASWSSDQVQPSTADTSSESTPSSETPVPSAPELSDTGEPDESLAGEPEPEDPPAPESPDDDADDGDASGETCLGVNALGLTVNLCLPSLLGG